MTQFNSTYDRITQGIRTCIEETFIDPSRIYCSVTGRPVGRVDYEILADIFAEIPECSDVEELCDDLLLRTLSSARPSPAWNNLDQDSLRSYIKTRPAEVLAYCLNRLYEPSNQLKVSSERRLFNYHQRITRWAHIQDFMACGYDISDLLYWLVQIDSQYNLTSLPIPSDDRLLTFGLITDHVGLKLFHDAWKAWYRPLHAEYERKLKAAIQQSTWLKGNTLAKGAHFDLWMDRKPESEPRTPEAKAAKVAKTVKQQQKAFMANLFDALAGHNPEAEKLAAPAQPVAVVSTKAPIRFGVKKGA